MFLELDEKIVLNDSSVLGIYLEETGDYIKITFLSARKNGWIYKVNEDYFYSGPDAMGRELIIEEQK